MSADKENPFAFDTLGVEIMKSARYVYVITRDFDRFRATATALRLEDEDAVVQWQIDESGELKAVMDDAIAR